MAALDGPGTDADVTPAMLAGRDRDKHRRMLRNACLVLAGPDPRAIADDPEGLEVLQELKNYFDTLPKEVQRDIKIVMVHFFMVQYNWGQGERPAVGKLQDSCVMRASHYFPLCPSSRLNCSCPWKTRSRTR